MTYGQTIHMDDGTLTVNGCATREEATRKAVELARDCGWKPKKHLGFFKDRKCPQHLRDEYDRQIKEASHDK